MLKLETPTSAASPNVLMNAIDAIYERRSVRSYTPEWNDELDVPPELTAYAPIILGFPAGETLPTGRRQPEVLSWKTGIATPFK